MTKKKNKKKRLFIFLTIVICIILIVILNFTRDKEKTILVEVDTVKRSTIVQTVSASGNLQPVSQVKISANVSGRIIRLGADEGDRVKKGDFLVELEREKYEAALERAQSSLKSARANLQKVRNDYERIKTLFEKGLSSNADIEAADAQLKLAEAQVEEARAFLRQSKDDLEKTYILSPMDGIVTSVRKEVGEIALGSTFQEDVIMTVADLSSMEAEVEVDETDIISVSPGDTAIIRVDALPDTTFRGVVTEIAHSARIKGSGTQEQVTNFPVKIRLLNTMPQIRPGMSATVDIITETRKNALVIPIRSLAARPPVEKNQETAEKEQKFAPSRKQNMVEVVFVVSDEPDSSKGKKLSKMSSNKHVKQRPVRVGISSDTHYEVLSGLKEGETIVVGGFRAVSKELKDGSAIEIKKSSP